MPRPFHCDGQSSLMTRAVPRDTTRNDLATISQKVFQRFDVFVINAVDTVGTEPTDFFLIKASPFIAGRAFAASIIHAG